MALLWSELLLLQLLPTISISELQFSAILNYLQFNTHIMAFLLFIFYSPTAIAPPPVSFLFLINSYSTFETAEYFLFWKSWFYLLDYSGHLCPFWGVFQFSRYLSHWTQHSDLCLCDSDFFENKLSVLFFVLLLLFVFLAFSRAVWHIIWGL